MIYTFKALQDQVLNWLDEASDTGTTRTNVRQALNQAHQTRLMAYPWPHMIWDRMETLTMVGGTQIYSLHQEFQRPLFFRNVTTKRFMTQVPARNVVSPLTNWADQQRGEEYVIWGASPVKAQPSSASVLTIVSSSGSDTGAAYQILIKGVTAAGDVTAEAIVPNGTTAAVGAISFIKILAVTKPRTWNGTLTITANGGAVTVLSLYDCEFGRSYQQWWVLSNPQGGDVIEYKFYRQPLLLINDFDIPEIPSPFQQILVWDALLLLMAYDQEIDSGRLAVIARQQKQLEDAMTFQLQDGQALGGQPHLIRDLEDDWMSGLPRVYSS